MAASMRSEISEEPVLESLKLSTLDDTDEVELTTGEGATGGQSSGITKYLCPCIFCEKNFNTTEEKDSLLAHMLTTHKFVIAEINMICDLKKYLVYWKQRFKEQPVTDFCSVVHTNSGDADTVASEETYYMLCDVLEEDKTFRQFLQKRKLEDVLNQQQREREDESFCKTCLFCREQFVGKRADLLNHMANDHSFNIGHPDNLVYTDELLDNLQEKLKCLQCLYCERTFKDRTVLKEHMRKKQHKKINPNNKTYDKYYTINYLELGKNWEVIQGEDDRDIMESDDSTEPENEWDGWEEEAGSQAVCLFCEFSSSNATKLRNHMQELHDLDLQEIKLRMNLNFYQQVKLINFIRRQVHLCVCYGCQEKFQSKQVLLDHMHQMNHNNSIPDMSVWDQPQYFFPTYENDNLLCQLEDDNDDDEVRADDSHVVCCHGNVTVIAEDAPKMDQTILLEESVRREILS